MDVKITNLPNFGQDYAQGIFKDHSDTLCELQESEFKGKPILLLGIAQSGYPMILTQEQVAGLIPLLQNFARTGSILP